MLLIFSHFLAPLKITTIRRRRQIEFHFILFANVRNETFMQKWELSHFRSSAFVSSFLVLFSWWTTPNELFTSQNSPEKRDKWEKETISITFQTLYGFISTKEIVESLIIAIKRFKLFFLIFVPDFCLLAWLELKVQCAIVHETH